MRRVAAAGLLFVLCTLVTCTDDTTAPALWPRLVEPRLSRLVPKATGRPCYEIETHDAALSALVYQPQCTDAAIVTLQTLSETNDEALADLSAAYFLRAKRQDRPTEYLDALAAANGAVARNPKSLTALFNRALMLQAVGLTDDAIRAWDAYVAADPSSEWAGDARRRRAQLQTPSVQWNPAQVRLALSRRAESVVEELIEPFPTTALRFFEEELLTFEQGELDLFARALSKRYRGDPYPLDVVRQLSTSRASTLWLADARAKERTFSWDKIAASPPPQGGNAIDLTTRLFHLKARPNEESVLPALDDLEQRARRYPRLLADIRSMRGFVLGRQNNYPAALKAYDGALELFEKLGDREGLAATHTRKGGVCWGAGQYELAWRELYVARQYTITSLKEVQNLLAETARTALALGHPAIALRYQNALTVDLRKRLVATPENLVQIKQLQNHLAMALQSRGAIRLHLGQFEEAERDLNETRRLLEDKDSVFLALLRARMFETEGQEKFRRDPVRAAELFTKALEQIGENEQFSFRVRLLAQRARAKQRAGDDPQADLRQALDELRVEEKRALDARRRGEDENLWIRYFSRFSDTYAHLIQFLFEAERKIEAFRYAERERTFEIRDLLLAHPDVPREFRELASDNLIDVDKLRALIPRGTVLVQYRVLDDITYVWVLSREGVTPRELRVGRATIEQWAKKVQDAAQFTHATEAPYAALIEPILPDIGNARRLVFIPDGAIHGLPLAALHDHDTDKYLIERAPIESAGGALLYLFSVLRDQAMPPAEPSVLLVGNPTFDKTLFAMNDLPNAEAEARQIGALYARSRLLLAREATVPAFLNAAKHATIIHVAAHGITKPRSLLLLAPSPGHYGTLEPRELLTELENLPSTRLFVLSACSSAGGLPVGPEGVAPLVRPLIAAGVPAVIGSLWDVADATTAKLFVSFHRHFVQGKDAATAMRDAQLELLEESGPRSVLTWAPFQVIGHASSPFAPARNGGAHLGRAVRSPDFLQRPDGLHPH